MTLCPQIFPELDDIQHSSFLSETLKVKLTHQRPAGHLLFSDDVSKETAF